MTAEDIQKILETDAYMDAIDERYEEMEGDAEQYGFCAGVAAAIQILKKLAGSAEPTLSMHEIERRINEALAEGDAQ